jgi:hypothetical protein
MTNDASAANGDARPGGYLGVGCRTPRADRRLFTQPPTSQRLPNRSQWPRRRRLSQHCRNSRAMSRSTAAAGRPRPLLSGGARATTWSSIGAALCRQQRSLSPAAWKAFPLSHLPAARAALRFVTPARSRACPPPRRSLSLRRRRERLEDRRRHRSPFHMLGA